MDNDVETPMIIQYSTVYYLFKMGNRSRIPKSRVMATIISASGYKCTVFAPFVYTY